MRGSIGIEGLMELYKFVEQGGVLITEGATSTVFPEYNLTPVRHHRDARQSLRARLGAEDDPRRQEQPGAVRLRPEHDGGVLQSGAGDACRRRQDSAAVAAALERTCRAVGNMTAECGAADADDARWTASGGGGGGRTGRTRRAAGAAVVVGAAVPARCDSLPRAQPPSRRRPRRTAGRSGGGGGGGRGGFGGGA